MKIKEFLAQEKRVRVGWLIVVLVLLVFAVICFNIAYIIERNKAAVYKEVLDYYQDTYRHEKAGNRSIISLDGGKNWYAYEKDSKGSIRIIGQVNR